jgi:hypothetical protein
MVLYDVWYSFRELKESSPDSITTKLAHQGSYTITVGQQQGVVARSHSDPSLVVQLTLLKGPQPV